MSWRVSSDSGRAALASSKRTSGAPGIFQRGDLEANGLDGPARMKMAVDRAHRGVPHEARAAGPHEVVKQRIRVAVVDRHDLLCSGIVRTLETAPDLAVVGRGKTTDDALEIVREKLPDVVVLGLTARGDCMTAIERITAEYPTVNILLVSIVAEEERAAAGIRRGARAYLPHGAAGGELIAGVRAVSGGQGYISSTPDHRSAAEGGVEPAELSPCFVALSSREQQVLFFLSKGHSNKEIAFRVHLAEDTVRHYMKRVLKKLQVRNRVQAAMLGRNWPLEAAQEQPPASAQPANLLLLSASQSHRRG